MAELSSLKRRPHHVVNTSGWKGLHSVGAGGLPREAGRIPKTTQECQVALFVHSLLAFVLCRLPFASYLTRSPPILPALPPSLLVGFHRKNTHTAKSKNPKTTQIALRDQSSRVFKCLAVLGCSHMMVFMAGASTKGFSGSQARKKLVAKLSQSPRAIFAKVFAEHGATTARSAHFRSSIWTTRSEDTSSYPSHSSRSRSTCTSTDCCSSSHFVKLSGAYLPAIFALVIA